jgi:cytochrome c556
MKRRIEARAALAAAGALLGLTLAADAAPGDGPGWTGITNPKDVINAREELMEEIEHVMQPIDTFEVEDVPDLNQLRLAANTVHVMLLALPHLFPPTTNLYDPKAETPATLALPAIWKDFATFYALAGAAAYDAEAMAENPGGKNELRAAGRALRASCDACHALFLRPYSPSKVQQSDIDFDFDSALKKK